MRLCSISVCLWLALGICNGVDVNALLEFSMSPPIINGITESFGMRCALSPSFQGRVESIKVTYDGFTVAKLPPLTAAITDGNLTVTGSLDSQPHLDLSWTKPGEMRTGVYTCFVQGTTQEGRHLDLRRHLRVLTRNATVHDLVKEIKDERLTDEQHSHLIETNHGYIDSLENENQALKNQVASLQTTDSNLQQRISDLESKFSSLKTSHDFVTNTGLEVRLLGGDHHHFGAVELTYNGRTGMLCDDSFDANNNGAKVVCRMLGFNHGVYEAGTDYIMMHTSNFVLDNVICTGSESSLTECSHSPYGNEDCSAGEIAGVNCW